MAEVSLSSGSKEQATGDTTGSAGPAPQKDAPKFYRGKEGKLLSMSANYLHLELEKDKGVFEYEVRFEPRTDNRDQRFRLLNQQREVIGGVKVSHFLSLLGSYCSN